MAFQSNTDNNESLARFTKPFRLRIKIRLKFQNE